jgi:hypothetical protein
MSEKGMIRAVDRLERNRRRMADDPALAEAVNDERFHEVKSRAFVFGFWSLVVYAAAVVMADLVWSLPTAGVMMQPGRVMAAATPILAFLCLERESTDAE